MLSSSIRSGLPVGASLPAQAPQLRLPGSHAAVLAPCRAGRSGIALEPLVASSSSGGSSSSISSSSMGSGATSSGVAAASSAWPASSSPAGGRALAGSALQRLRLGPMDVLTASMLPQAAESGEEGGDGYKVVSRVAYQGVPGAYSEIAANKACPGWEPLPCEHFEVAFQAISQWMAERAVLPIENSLGGSIHAVYDLLMRYQLHIVGEVSVEVNHCLLALPGVAKSEIRRVLSHPQALAQTDGYTRRMPGVVREAVDDTAGAAKMIAENGWRDAAAVASRRAAELYGMNILDEGIQDMADNVTRFIVLSRDPLVAPSAPAEARRYKTSVVFSLQEGPGMLFKALSVFALRDIDLTKIESRPMRSQPLLLDTANGGSGSGDGGQRAFNYLFYVDFKGSLADATSQNALRHLQEIAPFLRVLGSYPADTEM